MSKASSANMTEVLAVLHWSERARRAYARALAEYNRAGRPPVPMTARDYRSTYRAQEVKR